MLSGIPFFSLIQIAFSSVQWNSFIINCMTYSLDFIADSPKAKLTAWPRCHWIPVPSKNSYAYHLSSLDETLIEVAVSAVTMWSRIRCCSFIICALIKFLCNLHNRGKVFAHILRDDHFSLICEMMENLWRPNYKPVSFTYKGIGWGKCLRMISQTVTPISAFVSPTHQQLPMAGH